MKHYSLLRTLILLNLPILLMLVLLHFCKQQFEGVFMLAILGLVIIILANGIYLIIQRSLKKTINKLQLNIKALSQGQFDQIEELPANFLFQGNEINALQNKLSGEIASMHQSIQNIVSGDVNKKTIINQEELLLSKPLQKLQEKLNEDQEILDKSKKEEIQRNWIATGLAEFGDILRQDTEQIETMGYAIISKLVNYVKCNQGALYVLSQDEHEEEVYTMIASVAFDRQRMSNAKIKIGEGLVGRCAFEKANIYMTEIPNDYMNISSGLGTASPTNLLIIPCIIDESVFAIIELASFNPIESYQIDFIGKLGEGIGSSIANVKNRERTNRLLKASQSQADALSAHEEELRQNLEEMEATQEDLKRQMTLNAAMHKELQFEKFLFETLLNNIPARINFKDINRKYIRASKSFLERFGKQSNDEIIGKTDYDFFDAEFAEKTMKADQELIDTREGRINFIEHEVKENNEQIWKNVSKIPLIDEDGKCLGIFASVYDITDYKLAELENQSMKKELAALKKK